MDEDIKLIWFSCRTCGVEFSVPEKEFRGSFNWYCPSCGTITPPNNYSGFTIKGCENTRL